MADAVVIGSGAAGSVAAWELARRGYAVTVLERGRHLRAGFGELPGSLPLVRGATASPSPVWLADADTDPVTSRTQAQAAHGVPRSASGSWGSSGSAVGGTTVQYTGASSRFRAEDLRTLSALGALNGAQVADWPIDLDALVPFYDEVEARTGVSAPAVTGASDALIAAAQRAGLALRPQPVSANRIAFDTRPPCAVCGLCMGPGCPVNARGDALVGWLYPAMFSGRVRVLARHAAQRIETSPDGRRANGVAYRDGEGVARTLSADVVVLAANPLGTARLLLLSAGPEHPHGLGNSSGQVGRNLMLHNATGAALQLPDACELMSEDLIDPVTGRAAGDWGVPWIKGGLVEITRERLRLVHEDVPQAQNRVDLDPEVRDRDGLPVARVTYSPHRHERAAAALLAPRLEAARDALAAHGSAAPVITAHPLESDGATDTGHAAGTARMGHDPARSVCDAAGRLHELDNVWVADASTFPSFPGVHPTTTIMANALRVARGIG